MKKLFNKKTLVSLIFTVAICLIPFIVFADGVSAQDPGTFAVTALGKVKSLIWKIASPLAAVAVMVTFIIQKVSFGSQETIAMAKTWRRGVITGYIVIMCIDVLLYGIDALMGLK